MSFIVTRQNYSSMGINKLVVEVAAGGRDGANPCALMPRYEKFGEMAVFLSLSEAVDAAIQVAEEWKWDTQETIMIAVGNNHGGTIPFETEVACEEVYESLREKARKFDETLPRCARCGEIFSNRERYSHEFSDEEFCSEMCAERDYEEHFGQDEEEEDDDGEED